MISIDLHMPISMKAPINMITVWTKSVQMTAVRPPVMVNRAAIANRNIMEPYNPASPCRPIACFMKMAPENKSACNSQHSVRILNLKNQNFDFFFWIFELFLNFFLFLTNFDFKKPKFGLFIFYFWILTNFDL